MLGAQKYTYRITSLVLGKERVMYPIQPQHVGLIAMAPPLYHYRYYYYYYYYYYYFFNTLREAEDFCTRLTKMS
jgi:hypothetical protein